VLDAAGGIVVTALLDGSVIAFDDETLDAVADQCRFGLQRAAHDLFGKWKQYRGRVGSVLREAIGTERQFQVEDCQGPELRDMSQATVL
jgi:hypothetical protein